MGTVTRFALFSAMAGRTHCTLSLLFVNAPKHNLLPVLNGNQSYEIQVFIL